MSWLLMGLCLKWQYAIIDRTYLDTLGNVKIPLAFGAGFFVDFKDNSAFRDGVRRAHRLTVTHEIQSASTIYKAMIILLNLNVLRVK